MPSIRKLALSASVVAMLAPNLAQAHPYDIGFRNGLLVGSPYFDLSMANVIFALYYQLLLGYGGPGFSYGSPLAYAPEGHSDPDVFENFLLGYGPLAEKGPSFPGDVGGLDPVGADRYRGAVTGSLGYHSFGSDEPAIKFDADAASASAGGLLYASERLLFGALANYSDISADTDFNRGNLDRSTFTAAPFVIFRPNDWVAIDASAGLGWIDVETNRFDGFQTVHGETDGTLSFATAGVSVDHRLGNVGLAGRLGFYYQRTEYDDFIESNGAPVSGIDNELGMATLSAKASYAHGAFVPYVGATLRYFTTNEQIDVAPYQVQPEDDDFDAILRAGFDVQVSEQLSAGLQVQHLVGNSNLDETGVRGLISYRF